MRVLRVLSELFGQLFDLSRQLRDELDQLRELGVALRELGVALRELGVALRELGVALRELGVALRELGVALREGILEPRDASLLLLPLCVRVLASHGKLRSRSERAVDPRHGGQIGGVNGYVQTFSVQARDAITIYAPVRVQRVDWSV